MLLNSRLATISLLLFATVSLPAQPVRTEVSATSSPVFLIRVVDEATSRGVPLVQLTAASGISLVTDSAGYVAFREPALMNRDVYFRIDSHGYAAPADGFGMRGRTVRTMPGGEATLPIRRTQIAERLYRITGSGIYAESVIAGKEAPIREPLLNCGVTGQDSALCALYRGRLFWVWGDTSRPGHPLSANFRSTAAWSDLPGKGGLDPETGINLSYFCRGDFVKPMTDMPEKGMYWLSCLATVPDAQGKEHLVARYARVEPPMRAVGHGYVEFSDEKEVFLPLSHDKGDELIQPGGHTFGVGPEGHQWLYSPAGTTYSRVPRQYEMIGKPEALEAWTCLREGTRFTTASAALLDRPTSASSVRFSWKKNTSPVGYTEQEALIKAGLLAPEERWFHFLDVNTGKSLAPHATSVAWNPWRRRWTAVVSEIFGTSMVGEVWYAEADHPEGPWVYAQKIVTHDTYSFYNPLQHPELAKEGGRVVLFEGTYTMEFSGNKVPTPRYDYNQIMYKLDLADPRLALPVAVYRREDGRLETGRHGGENSGENVGGPDQSRIAFYAPDRPREGCVPIRLADEGTSGSWHLTRAESPAAPLFYVLSAPPEPPNPACVPLHEYRDEKTGRRTWATAEMPGWGRTGEALGYVWKNPAE